MGSPGTGKTPIAIGLGIEAYELKFEKYDLVIIDELGYISFDKEGTKLLFTKLSLRAGRAATIITSNLSIDHWKEVCFMIQC
ncbi:ATP-binding protein [Bacillus smithii]|nr:ATP-binding protein [Bacillus smithii]MED1457798.1 ATP-binding protein [Bacillus smithii]